MQVNISEAKAKLSSLVARALAGEEVVIARDNTPLLRLVPIEKERSRRRPGSARGLVEMSPDFDSPVPGWEDYTGSRSSSSTPTSSFGGSRIPSCSQMRLGEP